MTKVSQGPTLTVLSAGFDPVMTGLIRRAMPNLMAYDICGVQPMTGPTGLIFAMRALYGDTTNGDLTGGFETCSTKLTLLLC